MYTAQGYTQISCHNSDICICPKQHQCEKNKLNLNSLAPTMLINHNKLCVCLYGLCLRCADLICEPIQLFQIIERSKLLAQSGLLALWIIVNHRYVFMVCCNVSGLAPNWELPTTCCDYCQLNTPMLLLRLHVLGD